MGSSDIPALPGPEARLTHPLAEGGEGVQALLVLGRVPQLRVIAATALCGEKGDPVMGPNRKAWAAGSWQGHKEPQQRSEGGEGAHSDGDDVAGAT